MEYLHTMIRVRNLEESLAFYVGLLGFQEVQRIESEDDQATLVLLAAPDDIESGQSEKRAPVIKLCSEWDEAKRPAPGARAFAHVSYRVDDIYAACEHFLAHGGALSRPPRDGRKAYLKTLEGMTVELVQRQPAQAPNTKWLSMPDIGTWND